jgi:predicted TIM-barrel fold metal-dependent hydrolase
MPGRGRVAIGAREPHQQLHLWENATMSAHHLHLQPAAPAELNVAVKLSGAPSYSSHPYPYRNIHPYLRQIFDAFGPQRCFWGTDITRMPCSYRQCVTMFTEELPWLRGRDLELVMGEAICDWLGWQRPS